MSNNKPDPQTLLLIAYKAAELEALLKRLGTMPSYFNPNPANLPNLPWSSTTIGNLASDLAVVSGLCDSEVMQEEWGITDEMVDEILENVG